MSLRAYTDHVDDYNRTHTIEIHKDGYSGTVDYLKNTGSGYASFDYEKIDPKNPTDNPIQKGALEFSLWLQSSTLIDEIKTADEQTFWAVHKIDGTQEWIGYIYNDLSTYEEGFDNHPFRITLMAKDFTDLGGKDYLVSGSLPDSRERVIATIAHLLDTVGFDMPIKTHTSWIEENLTGDYDYLNEIYHETKALREFGRTGDESDQPITVEDALNKLCVNHGLLLKQADGAYWIDQLTEYEDPTSVQEATYDLTGSQTAFSTTNDLTVDANTSDLKVTIQQDNRDNSGLPGLRRVKNKYDHRTDVGGIEFPSIIEIPGNNFESYSQAFISDGDQKINLDFSVRIESPSGNDSITIDVELKAGGYWWNNDDGQWESSQYINTIDAVFLKPLGSDEEWRTAVDFDTTETPTDADGFLEVIIDGGVGDSVSPSITEYIDGNINILNPTAEQNSVSINYQLSQTDNYSVVSEIEDTIFGDGPNAYTVGALRHGSADDDITVDTWQRKGSTAYRNFHWNLLAEHLDVRRSWRRLLSATLKGLYYPWQILSYDSEYFYFLGGSWDLFTGNWEGELFSLDIQTGSDTFDDIPKFSDESGTGTSSGGSSGGGGGLDQSTADARYFNESENLSEGDPTTMRTNLGLGDLAVQDTISNNDWSGLDLAIENGGTGASSASVARNNLGLTDASADLDLNSLAIDGDDLFSLFYTEQEINSFFDLYYSKADLTDGDEDLHLDSLELQSGRFLAPTSYQFRNAGDTAFRDVEMAGLTATTGLIKDADPILRIQDTESGSTSANAFIHFSESDGSENPQATWRAGYGLRNFAIDFDGDVSSESFTRVFKLTEDGRSTQFGSDARHVIQDSESGSTSAEAYSYYSDSNASGEPESTWRVGYNLRNFSIGFQGNIQSSETFSDYLTIDWDSGDVTLTDNLLSDDFTDATWAGNGYRGTNAGDWVVENLRVRNALEVYEFVAKQISSVGGKEILSIANGRIESVNAGANEIEVQDVRLQNATSFKAGDLWIVQVVDINNDLQSGGTGSIVRSVRGQVTSVTGATLTVSVESGSLSDLEENDLIVAYGSSGETFSDERNAIMYRNVDRSDDNLIMRMQTGVDSFSALTAEANTAVAYGDLNGYLGITSEEFGFFAGDVSSNYILATENQVRAEIDELLVNAGGSGFGSADFHLDTISNKRLSLNDFFSVDATATTATIGNTAGSYIEYDSGSLSTSLDELDATIGNSIINLSSTTERLKLGSKFDYNDGAFDLQPDSLTVEVIGGGSAGFTNADFFLDASAHQMSLGSVFSADGGADEGRLAGSYFDSSDLWGFESGYAGDTSDKSNASVRLDFDEGAILYDAMGSSLNAKFVEAVFGSNNAPSLVDEEWFVENEVIGDNTTNSFVTPIRGRYKHKYGINELTLNAQARETLTIDSGSYANTGRIYIRVLDQEGGTVVEQNFIEISGSSYQSFTLTLDISSLTAGNYYVVEIDCWSQTSSQSATNDATDSASSRTYIREDYYLDTSTG